MASCCNYHNVWLPPFSPQGSASLRPWGLSHFTLNHPSPQLVFPKQTFSLSSSTPSPLLPLHLLMLFPLPGWKRRSLPFGPGWRCHLLREPSENSWWPSLLSGHPRSSLAAHPGLYPSGQCWHPLSLCINVFLTERKPHEGTHLILIHCCPQPLEGFIGTHHRHSIFVESTNCR